MALFLDQFVGSTLFALYPMASHCGAAIQFHVVGARVRVDILFHLDYGAFDIVEVKSSTNVKPEPAEVAGSNPVTPTTTPYIRHSHLGEIACITGLLDRA